MKKESIEKVCKNKKCQKTLPLDYKYKYCEACRNQRADTAKGVLRGIGAVTVATAGVAVAIITGGKIDLNK